MLEAQLATQLWEKLSLHLQDVPSELGCQYRQSSTKIPVGSRWQPRTSFPAGQAATVWPDPEAVTISKLLTGTLVHHATQNAPQKSQQRQVTELIGTADRYFSSTFVWEFCIPQDRTLSSDGQDTSMAAVPAATHWSNPDEYLMQPLSLKKLNLSPNTYWDFILKNETL